jgi:hypothetical protein
MLRFFYCKIKEHLKENFFARNKVVLFLERKKLQHKFFTRTRWYLSMAGETGKQGFNLKPNKRVQLTKKNEQEHYN